MGRPKRSRKRSRASNDVPKQVTHNFDVGVSKSTTLESANDATASEGSDGLVKVWQGNLVDGTKSDQPVITRLECYMKAANKDLVSQWPTSLIVKGALHEIHKDSRVMLVVGESHFLMFKSRQAHVFFQELRSMGDSALISVASQQMLLNVTDEDCCQLNGVLFMENQVFSTSSLGRQMPVWRYMQPEQVQQSEGELSGACESMQPGTELSQLNRESAENIQLRMKRFAIALSELKPVWMGRLILKHAGKLSLISTLEGFAFGSAAKVAADLPKELFVSGLMSESGLTRMKELDTEKKMAYVFFIPKEKELHLLFTDMYPDVGAVIKLPSQTMVLFVRGAVLTGFVFPADITVWPFDLVKGKILDLPLQEQPPETQQVQVPQPQQVQVPQMQKAQPPRPQQELNQSSQPQQSKRRYCLRSSSCVEYEQQLR